MLRLAADENFNGDVVRGIRRRDPNIDIVRIQAAAVKAFVDAARKAGHVVLEPAADYSGRVSQRWCAHE